MHAERNAVGSLVVGIVGLWLAIIPFLLPILAIVFGSRSRRALQGLNSGHRGLAEAGTALGWVGIATNAFGLLFFLSRLGD